MKINKKGVILVIMIFGTWLFCKIAFNIYNYGFNSLNRARLLFFISCGVFAIGFLHKYVDIFALIEVLIEKKRNKKLSTEMASEERSKKERKIEIIDEQLYTYRKQLDNLTRLEVVQERKYDQTEDEEQLNKIIKTQKQIADLRAKIMKLENDKMQLQ